MRITTKRIDNLTAEEFARCRELTLGRLGEMQDEADTQRYDAAEILPQYRARVYMAWDGDLMVGWAMSFCEDRAFGGHERTVYFYVHPTYRRKGIGTKLMRAATRHHGEVIVCPHDHVSGQFFNMHVDGVMNKGEVLAYA